MARDMVQVRRSKTPGFSGPDIKIGRSQFDRSHGWKGTFDASRLIPILVDEVLPGDTFTCKLNGFARIWSPLDAPIMDNIELRTEFFFVPNRLLWDNWVYFMGQHQSAGAQDVDYTIPVLASGGVSDHSQGTGLNNLLAYMGIPHNVNTGSVPINALPLRAYHFIYSEWYRDQNVINEQAHQTGNGPDSVGGFAIFKSAKKHDPYTSALPYLQKGDAQTVVDQAAVHIAGSPADTLRIYSDGQSAWHNIDTNLSVADLSSSTTGNTDGELYANVEIDINALRLAVATQRLLERDARGGTRYTELIKSHFGVTSPDFRLQRPEYLGGGVSHINISAVANTSEDASNKQGHLTGIGTGVIRGHGWAKSFTEHGYIIGIMRARGDVTYFQGIDRLWSRSSRLDFYFPALAHLGEQAIELKELYVQNNSALDTAAFGYQERWWEYRHKKSMVYGELNPDVTGAISFWHLAEDFGTPPVLGQTFVEDQTPMDRVTTVDTEHDFVADIWFDYKCARPIPVRSVPSLTGRF